MFKRILMAYKFTPNCKAALKKAAQLAKGQNSDLYVYHALNYRLTTIDRQDPRIVEMVGEANKKFEEEVRPHVGDMPIHKFECAPADPGLEICKVAHRIGADLILMGSHNESLQLAGPSPVCVMLVGLQGSGKTTTAAKMARWIKDKKNLFPLLVPADTSRPAAREQLLVLGEQAKIPTIDTRDMDDPEAIAKRAMREAQIKGYQVLVFDTAGRLHIDDELMSELERIKELTNPTEILLVADAMTGQDAVNTAKAFNDRLDYEGGVLTKLDGDTKNVAG